MKTGIFAFTFKAYFFDLIALLAGFLPLAALVRRRVDETPDNTPLHTELCSLEMLSEHARALAASHTLAAQLPKSFPLLKRLNDNDTFLLEAYQSIARHARGRQAVSPAAEWLLDNYHVVEEQIREIKEDLPQRYYHELPTLGQGANAGQLRVYDIALAILIHSDCRLDSETVQRFLRSYQTVKPLTIGELWAVPIMLRVALCENLRRLMQRSLWAQEERAQADTFADDILAASENAPTRIFLLIAEFEQSRRALSHPFAVQLLQRLRDQGANVSPVLVC